MVFSTNQVRQLYVVKTVGSSAPTGSTDAGTAFVKSVGDNQVAVMYAGEGGVTRSDLINKNQILKATSTRYDKLQRGLGKWELSLDSNINDGDPIAGQNYLVRIVIREWGGLSPSSQYAKYAIVRATTGMTTKDFYTKLKESLEKNFSREPIELFTFALDSTSAPTKVVIEEVEQPWALGIKESRPLDVLITVDPVLSSGDMVESLKASKVTSTTVVDNGKKMADLEYFCMGERGDIYRGMGFPNVIKTTYLVDPTTNYNVIDIAFSFVGDGEDSQRSDKQITFLVPAEGDTEADKITTANSLITKLNAELGTNTIPALVAKT